MIENWLASIESLRNTVLTPYPHFSIRACPINEQLSLEWRQREKYELKHMVANSVTTTWVKSGLRIW
ncbi:hypothetical protein TNCV_366761 [Trichonephila clavipes]|nr:hypothetical protein TNCV_366761 [Trichonephila clavipes]